MALMLTPAGHLRLSEGPDAELHLGLANVATPLEAVLYGVGARLDREPELLFVLRGVDKLDLVGAAAGGALLERTTDEGR